MASLYRLAYEEELVATNPCARVTRPKIHRELQRREVLTVLEYLHAVDEHMYHARGETAWRIKSRVVDNGCWIEDHDVGVTAGIKTATIAQLPVLRR